MDKKIGLEHTIRNIMGQSIRGNYIKEAKNVQKISEQLNEYYKYKATPEVEFIPGTAPVIPNPGSKPKKPEVQPSPKPSEPEVQPSPKPSEPEVQPSPTPKSPEETIPGQKLKSGEEVKPSGAPKAEEGPNKKPDSPKKTETSDGSTKKTKKPGFPIISFPLSVNPLTGTYGGTNVRTVMHTPEERLGESTDADNIRRSIENVARPTSKNKLTKLAEIKTKIIDENVRKANIVRKAIQDKKANSHIDTKPKLKDLELDEKFLKSFVPSKATVGRIGAGGALGATGVLGPIRDVTDTPDRTEKKDWLGVPNKEYGGVDMFADFASMVPGFGIPASIYSGGRSWQRGDKLDAYLDYASAIPGFGTAIKGLKLLGKGSNLWGAAKGAFKGPENAIERVGNKATHVITGAEFGDIGHGMYQGAKENKEKIEKLKQSGDWDRATPESKKKLEDLSTMKGQLKSIGSEYGSQIYKDVLKPAGEAISKTSIVSSAGAATPEKGSLSSLKPKSGKGDLPTDVAAKMKKSDKPNNDWFIMDAKGRTYKSPSAQDLLKTKPQQK